MEQRLIDGNKASVVLQNIKNSLDGSPAKPVDMRAVILAAVNIIDEQPTIDPVHAAGGCYCRECLHHNKNSCPAYDAPMNRTSLRIEYCNCGELEAK